MEYILICICIILVIAIILKIKGATSQSKAVISSNKNYRPSDILESKFLLKKIIVSCSKYVKNILNIILPVVSFIIWSAFILLLFVFVVCIFMHPAEMFKYAVILIPLLVVICIFVQVKGISKNFVPLILIIFVLIFYGNKIPFLVERLKNISKEVIKIEKIKERFSILEKDPEAVKKDFDEFFKIGEYIPINKFKKEILKKVKDINKVGDVWFEVNVFDEEYSDDFLRITRRTTQKEIDEYIENIRKNKKVNYIYVQFNDDVLHTGIFVENKSIK